MKKLKTVSLDLLYLGKHFKKSSYNDFYSTNLNDSFNVHTSGLLLKISLENCDWLKKIDFNIIWKTAPLKIRYATHTSRKYVFVRCTHFRLLSENLSPNNCDLFEKIDCPFEKSVMQVKRRVNVFFVVYWPPATNWSDAPTLWW